MAYVGQGTPGKVLTAHAPSGRSKWLEIGSESGLTAHGVVIAEGTGAFVATSAGAAGQVLTSNGAGVDPSFQNSSSTGAITMITGNSGGPEVPLGGNFNVLGTGSITTVGTANTETVQLTGLTNHAVLIGAGTATITKVGPTATAGQVLQSAGAAADPVFSTATYPSTTTINQLLYSSSANTVAGLTAANSAILISTSAGVPVWSSTLTNGQIIIGSTGATPAASTLTAGAGISITNAAGSITIAVSGSGFTWTDVTSATQTLAIENGYITDRGAGVTYTLPATAAIGDVINIVGKLGIAVITPNANQQILIGTVSGTVGVTGTATATNVGDCIILRCTTGGSSTVWRAESYVGTWVLA